MNEIEEAIAFLKCKEEIKQVCHKTTFEATWNTETGDDVQVQIEVQDFGPGAFGHASKRRYQVVVKSLESGETVLVSSLEESVIVAFQTLNWKKLHGLAIPEEDPLANLTPVLRKGICYRTNVEGLMAILADGFIRPNRGEYPFTWAVSENSFGFRNGYVCLFDLESASEAEVIRTRESWQNLFVQFDPFTVVFMLDRAALQERLIPQSQQDPSLLFIPHVEVWYPEPIPLSAVQGVLLVSGDRSGMHFSCELKQFDSLNDLNMAMEQWQEEGIHELTQLAAYKRWEQRGRPLWDDLCDWHEAEQLIASEPPSAAELGTDL
jgi:hypothetical protein